MKKLIVLLIIICYMCMFTGCKNSEYETTKLNQPYNISFVTAIANNNPVLNVEMIQELNDLSELAGSTYSFILADSTPSIICNGTIPDFTDKGYSEEMIIRAQSSVKADIFSQLSTAEPDSNEVDIASATALAVRTLRSNQVEGRDNILLYYSSGISTWGPIDMKSIPIYELDVEKSADTIANMLNLDLTNFKIIWYCCGDVSGKQKQLSENEKQILKNFYTALLTKMGASEVVFREDVPYLYEDDEYLFDYYVSTIETEESQSSLSSKVVTYEKLNGTDVEEIFEDGNIISFDDKSISFIPDSTKLSNPENAMDVLSYITYYMNENPEFELLICGTTTSKGSPQSCIIFSEQRAQAIRSLLIEKGGIDKSRIFILGCGWSSSLYIPDRTTDGNLNENAKLNRTVKLLDYNSDTALNIKQSLDIQ